MRLQPCFCFDKTEDYTGILFTRQHLVSGLIHERAVSFINEQLY